MKPTSMKSTTVLIEASSAPAQLQTSDLNVRIVDVRRLVHGLRDETID